MSGIEFHKKITIEIPITTKKLNKQINKLKNGLGNTTINSKMVHFFAYFLFELNEKF